VNFCSAWCIQAHTLNGRLEFPLFLFLDEVGLRAGGSSTDLRFLCLQRAAAVLAIVRLWPDPRSRKVQAGVRCRCRQAALIPQPPVTTRYQSSVSDGKLTPGVCALPRRCDPSRIAAEPGADSDNAEYAVGARRKSWSSCSRFAKASATVKPPCRRRICRRKVCHSGLPRDHRTLRVLRHSRFAELSLFNLSSLQNYWRSGTISRPQSVGAGCARPGGADDRQCVPDGDRGCGWSSRRRRRWDTSKFRSISVGNHQAGTAPLLDELRARVDYQTQQQTLIAAKNSYEKDKIALARPLGCRSSSSSS